MKKLSRKNNTCRCCKNNIESDKNRAHCRLRSNYRGATYDASNKMAT